MKGDGWGETERKMGIKMGTEHADSVTGHNEGGVEHRARAIKYRGNYG